MTKIVPTIATESPLFSSNDSHIHKSPEAKARRERLGITLKAGETDEVDAPGPAHLCPVCSPNGELPPPERPGNRTYDNSPEIAEENEKEELKRRVADLEELVRSQSRAKNSTPAKPAA